MSEKVMLITGGSRGLGKKIVERLSANKANKVYYTFAHAEKDGGGDAENTTAVRCDQNDERQIIDCVSNIMRTDGRLDVLVNNACPPFRPCEFLLSEWKMFQDLIDVNVRGAYIFSREAAKIMKPQEHGKIINILTSYILNIPPEKIPHYITAKYALWGLSKALASELGRFGITVNMVSPGLMDTDLSGYLPRRYLEACAARHPMKRLTTTDDAAKVVEFLASGMSEFLNGVNIPVNGGDNF